MTVLFLFRTIFRSSTLSSKPSISGIFVSGASDLRTSQCPRIHKHFSRENLTVRRYACNKEQVHGFIGLLIVVLSFGLESCRNKTAHLTPHLSSPAQREQNSLERRKLLEPETFLPKDENLPYEENLSPETDADDLPLVGQIGISDEIFQQLVDDAFYTQSLNCDKAFANLVKEEEVCRLPRLRVAYELRERLGLLSPYVRTAIGKYDSDDYRYWIRTLPELISPGAFNHLADSRLYALFPHYKDNELNPQSSGQVWLAIADELQESLQSRKNFEVINLYLTESEGQGGNSQGLYESSRSKTICNSGICRIERSQVLQTAANYVYAIWLEEGMTVLLSESSSNPTNRKILTPYNKVLLNSPNNMAWKGDISETGFYKILITSDHLETTSHHLILLIEQ